MEPNWILSRSFLTNMCTHAAMLDQTTIRSLLKIVRDTTKLEEAGNLFFPHEGLFGCDLLLAHILKYEITDCSE